MSPPHSCEAYDAAADRRGLRSLDAILPEVLARLGLATPGPDDAAADLRIVGRGGRRPTGRRRRAAERFAAAAWAGPTGESLDASPLLEVGEAVPFASFRFAD